MQKQFDVIAKAAVADATEEIKHLKAEIERKSATEAKLDKEIDGLRSENERMKNDIDSKTSYAERLEGKVKALQDDIASQRTSQRSYIERLRRKVNVLESDNKKLKEDCDGKDSDIRSLGSKNQKLEKSVNLKEKVIQRYQRHFASESPAEQHQQDARQLPQSVSSEENDTNEDEKKLRDAVMSTIVKGEVGWDDVAGMVDVKNLLIETVILPMRFPSMFTGKREPSKGILLYGPPGTGKSYIAKVVATEADCSFFSIKASTIGSQWKGVAENTIKKLFEVARSCARAVIFIDEIDALCQSRDGSIDDTDRKVLTEFLTQIDGVPPGNQAESQGNVLVLAATNMPWDLDSAILDRLKKQIYVPLPDEEARLSMLKIHIGDTPNSLAELDYKYVARALDGASSRDVEAIVKDALNEQVGEAQRAMYFRPEEDLYLPVLPCEHCPRVKFSACSQCGAKKMVLDDVPDDKLKSRDVLVEDFKRNLKPSYNRLTADKLHRYSNWANTH